MKNYAFSVACAFRLPFLPSPGNHHESSSSIETS